MQRYSAANFQLNNYLCAVFKCKDDYAIS